MWMYCEAVRGFYLVKQLAKEGRTTKGREKKCTKDKTASAK